MPEREALLQEAIRLAADNRTRGGRPFGAVLAIGGEIVATGVNGINQSHDPTSHAELEALRAAGQRLGRADLSGSEMYASGHPCPMCLAAMIMAGVGTVYYAFDNQDAAPYGLSSEATYQRLGLKLDPPPMPLVRLSVGVTAANLYGG